jgi:hypothetical protein
MHMQFTRTIASLLVAAMAFSAMPSFAEGEDAPLPGDFQAAPAPKPAKSRPSSPPTASPAVSAEKHTAIKPAARNDTKPHPSRQHASRKTSKNKSQAHPAKGKHRQARQPAPLQSHSKKQARRHDKLAASHRKAGHPQAKAPQHLRSKKATPTRTHASPAGKNRSGHQVRHGKKTSTAQHATRHKNVKHDKATKKTGKHIAKPKK